MSSCPSVHETALQMAQTAFTLLVLTLSFGHFCQGKPLDQLGQRPMGTGLWSYLYNQVNEGVGMWGYDSSLGAWSPLIRVSLHFCAIFGLWATSLVFLGGKECVSSWQMTMCGMFVSIGYLTFFYVYMHCMPNVSHPGGPRAHKIQRKPLWSDVTTPTPNAIVSNWRCAVAQDSHQVTETLFQGTAGSLTGEPAGRQIWTNNNDSVKKPRVDEHKVQEMASGGRAEGFNPSVNPNRYVLYVSL